MALTRREALAFMTSTLGIGAMAAYAPIAQAATKDEKKTEPDEDADVKDETTEEVEEEQTEVEVVADETMVLITQARHNIRGNSDPLEPLALLHISDVHGDDEALGRVVAWADAHEDVIDDILATGDLAHLEYADGMRFWKKVKGAERILTCIGNHDVYDDPDTHKAYDKVAVEDAADKYIDAYASSWGDIDHEAGTTWYAKDYPERNIRLIVLDCMVYLGENSASEAAQQNAWLEATLKDARKQNLTVVLGEHLPLADESMVDCSWAPFDRKFAYGPFLADDVTSRVQAFVDKGGDFACYLCGHSHCDAAHILPDHPEQFALTVPCTTDADDQFVWGDMDRSLPETRDAFNLVIVDTENGLVKVVRIGADRDLALQHRGTLAWDYRRHHLVHAD